MSLQQKIQITRPNATGSPIVGILQRANESNSAPATAPKRIALIIHGVLAHKDQIYHKRLAQSLADNLSLDSFRYDLQGQGGESLGDWRMGGHDMDRADLEIVIAHLATLGYSVHIIIAHSRGSIFSSYFLSTRQHSIPYFVDVSGRLKMNNLSNERTAQYDRDFQAKGYSVWKVRVAGQEIIRNVTLADVEDFTLFDNSYIHTKFPQDMDVLCIHGDADELVPVKDAHTYHKIFSNRSPGTSTLITVPDAGHNWIKPYDEPVNSIVSWLAQKQKERAARGFEEVKARL